MIVRNKIPKSIQFFEHFLYARNIESNLLLEGGRLGWDNLPFDVFQPFRRVALGTHDSFRRFNVNHDAILRHGHIFHYAIPVLHLDKRASF